MSGYKLYTSEINILDNEGKNIVGTIHGREGKVNLGNPTYSDSWFQNLLVNQPPDPGFTGDFRTSVNIGFTLVPPEQFNFGAMIIPHLDNLNISIENPNGSDVMILENSKNFLPSSQTPIEMVILSKDLPTGYTTFNGKAAYVYYSSNFDSFIVNDKIKVNVWYKNSTKNVNESDLNILTVELNSFIGAYPPSIVRDINLTPYSLSLVYMEPEFTNNMPDEPDNSVAIKQYKIEYISSLPTDRFIYNEDSGVIETGNTDLYYPLTNLIPGTTYTISVSAQNMLNPNYGPVESITIKTLPPDEPTLPDSLTLGLPSSHYYSQVKSFSTNLQVMNKIYTEKTNIGSCTPLSNLAIHTLNTIGSGDTGLSSLSFIIDGNEPESTISFDGFKNDNTLRWNLTNSLNNKATFDDIALSDVYTGNSTFFYSQIQNVTPKFTITSENYLLIKNEPYNCNLNYSINDTEIVGSNSFYIDGLSKAPSGICGYTSDSIPTKNITGIPVAGSSNNQSITYWITANDIGYNFYRSDKIIDITHNFVNVSGSTISNLPAGVTGERVPETLNYTSQNFTVSFRDTTDPLFGISFAPKIYNYYTPNGSEFTCDPFTVPKIVDFKSFTKSIKTSIQTINKSYTEFRRVATSVSMLNSFNNGVFTVNLQIPYNNSANLVTENIDDLPIVKGKYATGKYDPNYFTGISSITFTGNVDYTSLNNETKYRYVCGVWNLSDTIADTINRIRIKLTGFVNDGMSYNEDSNNIVGDGFELFYKLEQYSSSSVFTPEAVTPDGTGNYSTVWINGNSNVDNSFQTNSRVIENNKTVSGLVSIADASINNPNVSDFIYNLQAFSLSPKSLGDLGYNIRVYVIIRVKMDKNISFDNIYCDYNIF
jgi:hypothetical protein